MAPPHSERRLQHEEGEHDLSRLWGSHTIKDLRLMSLGFRDLGFRDLGFRDLGFRGLGFQGLGLRD